MVGARKQYLMQKSLIELFGLTDGGDAKTFGAHAISHAITPPLAPGPPGETLTNWLLT